MSQVKTCLVVYISNKHKSRKRFRYHFAFLDNEWNVQQISVFSHLPKYLSWSSASCYEEGAVLFSSATERYFLFPDHRQCWETF